MQVTPNQIANEPDTFFLLNSTAITSSTLHIQRTTLIANKLSVEHARPPLLPPLITTHNNTLSHIFSNYAASNTPILHSLSQISTDMNQRLSKLNAYSIACKQTQKSIESLRQLRQKTSIDQRKVDAALADLAFQKNVEIETKDALDECSSVLKRGVSHWRQGYTVMVNTTINELAEAQLKCHSEMVQALEDTLSNL